VTEALHDEDAVEGVRRKVEGLEVAHMHRRVGERGERFARSPDLRLDQIDADEAALRVPGGEELEVEAVAARELEDVVVGIGEASLHEPGLTLVPRAIERAVGVEGHVHRTRLGVDVAIADARLLVVALDLLGGRAVTFQGGEVEERGQSRRPSLQLCDQLWIQRTLHVSESRPPRRRRRR
jgi:hypothetical protein